MITFARWLNSRFEGRKVLWKYSGWIMLHLSPPSCCCCSSGMFAGLLGGPACTARPKTPRSCLFFFYSPRIKYEFMNLEEPPSFWSSSFSATTSNNKININSASPSPDFYSFPCTRMVILRSHRCPLTSDLLAIGPLVILWGIWRGRTRPSGREHQLNGSKSKHAQYWL